MRSHKTVTINIIIFINDLRIRGFCLSNNYTISWQTFRNFIQGLLSKEYSYYPIIRSQVCLVHFQINYMPKGKFQTEKRNLENSEFTYFINCYTHSVPFWSKFLLMSNYKTPFRIPAIPDVTSVQARRLYLFIWVESVYSCRKQTVCFLALFPS